MMTSSRKVGRNDPCPCGSGKKYKKCCLNATRLEEPSSEWPEVDLADLALAEREEAALQEYDPFTEPDPEQWLALEEEERIDLVVDYHRRARIRFPRAELHAIIHVIVENQIADPELPVRRTAERLMSEGLDRHEAVHAIGSVLAGYVNDLVRDIKSGGDQVETEPGGDPHAGYFAELEALTAEEWRRSG